MSMIRLAFSNFRRSLREYMALVAALAFSVFIFYNFRSIIYSESMDVLKSMNKRYIDIVAQCASVVFVVFLFFFLWYATNVFLRQRKREIGIYTFLGLDNRKIARMYVLEASGIGLTALILGLGFGALFAKLFQMLLFWLSDIQADVRFSFSPFAAMNTIVIFGVCYLGMLIKGYVSIVRSSVLALLSKAKQEELQERSRMRSTLQTLLGLIVLLAGFGCALNTGRGDVFALALAAVILVIAGTYLSFGGAIPAAVKHLTKKKDLLYRKERNLWINSLAFRIKQNYRTYAMVTVLMISAVTVLAVSMALKQRYDRMVHFRETYSFQVVSSGKELDGEELTAKLREQGEIVFGNELTCLVLSAASGRYNWKQQEPCAFLSYSQLCGAAQKAGLEVPFARPEEGEAVLLNHVVLMSFAGSYAGGQVDTEQGSFTLTGETATAYLGDLQSQMSAYVVSDEAFRRMEPSAEKLYLYNYKLADESEDNPVWTYVSGLAERQEGEYSVGVNRANLSSSDIAWIRVFYALCVFMFLTLILAGGSIILIKLNNDAYNDRQRYRILEKLGVSRKRLKAAIKCEIRFAYGCPFVFMVITSLFSVKALANVVHENLLMVNFISAAAVLALFFLIYLISVRSFVRKVLD